MEPTSGVSLDVTGAGSGSVPEPAHGRRRALRVRALASTAVAVVVLTGATHAAAAERKVVLRFKSPFAERVEMDMDRNGTMGPGDMVVYKPVPLYTLKGRRVGERGVFTSIIGGEAADGSAMAMSTVHLYFRDGSAIHEMLYAPGHFNGVAPLKPGMTWRRAVIGGSGRFAGARGEDAVRSRGKWVYFTLRLRLPVP